MTGLDALHRHQFWDGVLAVLTLVLASAAASAGIAAAYGTAGTAQIAAGIACAIAALLVAYGALIEPQRVTVRRQRIADTGLPKMRIAVIADFHVGPLKGAAFLRRIVAQCNALAPDLILLPGDFLYDATSSTEPLAVLAELRAPLGVFATIGNHDSGSYITLRHATFHTDDRSDAVTSALKATDITVLRNAVQKISVGGTAVAIAGIEDLWSPRYAQVPEFLARLDRSTPTVLISHHPDAALDPVSAGINLVVSGHTHGGQIRLPFIGSLLPIPSALGRRYDTGLFRLPGGTALFITHGIGETILRARLCTPPEVVLLEIE